MTNNTMKNEVKVVRLAKKENIKVTKLTAEEMIRKVDRYVPTASQWVDIFKAHNIEAVKSKTSDITFYIMKNDEVFVALQFHDVKHTITAFSRKASLGLGIFNIRIGSKETRRKAIITSKECLQLLGI